MINPRMASILVSLLLIFFMVRCSIPEAEDVDPPTVVILYPYTGSIISGQVLISIESTDDDRVEQVWYYLDGVLIERSGSSSPKFELNTAPYADGQVHTLSAAARDKNDNIGYSTQVLVTISDTDDNVPPTVQILNPLSGQIVHDTVRVLANAADDRIVQSVAFFVDGDSVYSDPVYPFEYLWPAIDYADSSEHTVFAKAFDGSFNWAISERVTVTIFPSLDQTSPTALLVYPLPGQLLSGIILVQVDAADDKQLDRVEFFVDGARVRTVPADGVTGLFTYSWNTNSYAPNSQHTLYFKAFDRAGNQSVGAPVTFTIGSQDVIAPTVSILYPPLGTLLNGIISVQADARDNIALNRVEFFVDGQKVHIVSTDTAETPFGYRWDTRSYQVGSQHTIFVKAIDDAGNESISALFSYEVGPLDTEPPVINLLYPAPGDTISGTVIVAADVRDNFGVSRVEFFIDGGLNGQPNQTLTTPPWIYTWNTAPLADNRQHTVYIRARDTSGNISFNGPNAFVVR